MRDPVLTPDMYPNLKAEGYSEESLDTPFYNCIAWAAGDTRRWWWPHPNAYWPAGCPLVVSIDAFSDMFESLGYEECVSENLEIGVEKIALYALGGVPTHAARQKQDGSWTSKIGNHIDIAHTLLGLEGPRYGNVVKFFKKII